MDELKGNNQGSDRGNKEQHSQPEHPIAGVARKAMGATPKTTVGWASVVACLSAMLYFSGQVDTKIDGRISLKLDKISAVYDEKFSTLRKDVDENKADIKAVANELNSRNQTKGKK